MHFARFTALAISCLSIWIPLKAEAFEKDVAEIVLAGAVDGYIKPAFHQFLAATDDLRTRSAALCEYPSAKGLATLKERFGEAVAAWAGVDFIRIGPLLEKNRLERLLFFPDRKSATVKQVQALLDSGDESIADPKALVEKSVAVQGLAAYELAFFGGDPDSVIGAKKMLRCRYGAAVAENIHAVAAELSAAWDAPDGVAAHFKTPGANNPLFRNDGEALTALLGLHVHAVEALRDQRLKAFYPGAKEKPQPKSALFRRSGNTMASQAAEYTGLKNLWAAADMAALLDEDIRSVSGSIVFDLNTLIKTTSGLAEPDETNLADDKYRAKMDFLLLTSQDLLARLNDEYGKAIGLGAGFSFSDGD